MGARVATAVEHSAQAGGLEKGVERTPAQMDAVVDALWLATLQSICARAAHEVRGALNAVAVNLEVARSRSEKPGAPASSVSPYANTAAGQLETVIAMTEALMHVVRSARGPVDIGVEITRVVALLAPPARAVGRTIELDRDLGGLGTTRAGSSSARLAIGHCLLVAADASADVRCAVAGEEGRLRVEHGGGVATLDGAVIDALATAGIEVRTESSAIVITFPR